MTEGAKCPIELKPMAKWVGEEDPKGLCRPCMLGPVVQWYRSELEENKHKKLADDLMELAEDPGSNSLKLCEKLDIIKDEVEEPLRERLKEFDCAAQSYEPEDET